MALRLGLPIEDRAGVGADGIEFCYRVAGGMFTPPLPFFIQWRTVSEAERRGLVAGCRHEVEPLGFAWIEVGGNAEELRDWLGGADIPVRVSDGRRSVRKVGVTTSSGEVTIS